MNFQPELAAKVMAGEQAGDDPARPAVFEFDERLEGGAVDDQPCVADVVGCEVPLFCHGRDVTPTLVIA